MDDGSVVKRSDLLLPRPYRAPKTEIECALEEIWRSVLTMDRIGIDDTNQELGGDSFLGAAILSLVDERFGVRFGMAALVDTPTIERLAAELEQAPGHRLA